MFLLECGLWIFGVGKFFVKLFYCFCDYLNWFVWLVNLMDSYDDMVKFFGEVVSVLICFYFFGLVVVNIEWIEWLFGKKC